MKTDSSSSGKIESSSAVPQVELTNVVSRSPDHMSTLSYCHVDPDKSFNTDYSLTWTGQLTWTEKIALERQLWLECGSFEFNFSTICNFTADYDVVSTNEVIFDFVVILVRICISMSSSVCTYVQICVYFKKQSVRMFFLCRSMFIFFFLIFYFIIFAFLVLWFLVCLSINLSVSFDLCRYLLSWFFLFFLFFSCPCLHLKVNLYLYLRIHISMSISRCFSKSKSRYLVQDLNLLCVFFSKFMF